MKRIWLFVLLGVLWLCIALSASVLTGDSQYLAWAIFLPIVLALINAARPRRGIHYVYWNRYLAVFGGMLLGMAAIPVISVYLVVTYNLSTNVFVISSLVWLILFVPGFLLWFKFYFMPTWGPWRLRNRYPRMVAAASRFKKFGESYTWYFPLILVQDKPYLVVGYNTQYLSGLATLDEQGRFIKDETLALTLLRCYKLAMAVVHMPDSHARAKDIDSHERTDRQVQRAFQYFRENEAYFLAAGQTMHDHWKNLCLFEPYVHAVIRISTHRKNWQAKWALDHGLNRLTEVTDKQLCEAEEALAGFNRLLAEQSDHLNQIAADAEALLKFVQGNGKSRRLNQRSTIEEMLKALIVLRQGALAWQKEVTDFLPLENEWRAWQRRKALAEKFEREGEL